MASYQGQILLAASDLRDPNFVQSVLLMVRHGEDGALGLVLNRPLETSVKEACERALNEECEAEGMLHQGGPCDGPLMALHTEEGAGEIEVVPGVFFTTGRDKLQELLQDPSATAKYFIGYSGWSPGQLENEFEMGSWLTAPATKELIFEADDRQWKGLILQLMTGRRVDPRRIPDDPSVN